MVTSRGGRTGRTPRRQAEVHAALRRLITGGRLQPGDRLPVRGELQRRFGASCITVQLAMDRLAAEGLVVPQGARGTFVAARPPHLHRIALVLPGRPDRIGYFASLARAVADLRAEGHDLVLCLGSDGAAIARLQEACRDGLLAGVIFAATPETWIGTPLVDAPLPRIALTETSLDIVQIRPDHESIASEAARLAVAHGRRRPAVITASVVTDRPEVATRWLSIFADAGVPLRPQWFLGLHLDTPAGATRLCRLLFSPWAGERPDVLVIADDHFEDPALSGLLAEGVQVGGDDGLLVIAHANFPVEDGAERPVIRIGFDATAILRQALGRLEALRSGAAVTSVFFKASPGS